MNNLSLKPLSNLELAGFCNQLSMILSSGIAPFDGISMLLETASDQERALLSSIQNGLEETGELQMALRQTQVFPAYLLDMVTIGEETGTLDEVLASLAHHYARKNTLTIHIKQAITYPFVMVTLMTVVIVILVTQVMPVFNQVFLQLGSELQGISHSLLVLGDAINTYGVIFGLLIFFLAAGTIYLSRTSSGKKHLFRLVHKVPFTRTLSEKISTCQLAGGMALVLNSGLTEEQAITLSKPLVSAPSLMEKLDICQQKLEEGEALSDALCQSGIFIGIQGQMVSIAGKTGHLEETLEQLSSQYEEETYEQIQSLLSTVEPTLVIILSFVVGTILLSVMIPLLGIVAGL